MTQQNRTEGEPDLLDQDQEIALSMRLGDVLEIYARGWNMTPEVWDALIAACREVSTGYEAIKAEREKATKGRKS